MARTTQDIYDSIVAEKDSQATLNGLQPAADTSQTLLADVASTSRVADWRLWAWVVAVSSNLLEMMWDTYKTTVESIVNAAPYASTRWYQQQALKFQIGYQLVWQNNKFEYSVVDTAAQIVQRAAVIENGNQVLVKAAKVVSGVVTPLSSVELNAFQSYMSQIRYPGTSMAIISQSADLLQLQYTIYYDAQIPLTTVRSNVEAVVNDYISNLPFDGVLVITKLTDAIQSAQGVINPVWNYSAAKYGTLGYTPFTVSYQSNAGHMVVDPLYPMSLNFTYTASV